MTDHLLSFAYGAGAVLALFAVVGVFTYLERFADQILKVTGWAMVCGAVYFLGRIIRFGSV